VAIAMAPCKYKSMSPKKSARSVAMVDRILKYRSVLENGARELVEKWNGQVETEQPHQTRATTSGEYWFIADSGSLSESSK